MIVFVDYQYKGIGGVAQIVVNTILELNKRGLQAKAYCSPDSYEYKKLIEYKAQFTFINSDKVKLKQLSNYIDEEDCIILTNIVNTPLLEKLKKINNRILFYNVHPETFKYNKWLDFLCNQTIAVADFVEAIWQHNALCIMDYPNLKSIYDIGVKKRDAVKYLPVPVKSYINIARHTPNNNNHLITYLGRGNAEWKIFPLIKVLEDLNKIGESYKMAIITDTNDLFIKMINEYIPHNKVDLEFINNLDGPSLDRFLYENSFVHIAMGTSALEGGKLGIPTILVDICKEEFPNNYLYRWLHETQDFCLAGEIVDGVLPYQYGDNLEALLKRVETNEGYATISNECKTYVDINHSIEAFVDNLLIRSKKTNLTTSIYCSTAFSKNIKTFLPIINFISKVKHLFI